MKKPRAFLIIENADGTPVRSTELQADAQLAPTAPYRVPEDVPVPLRWNIKYAADTGLTSDQIAKVYDIPVEWVDQFCRECSTLQ